MRNPDLPRRDWTEPELAAALRRLPQPPAPADLKARLLTSVPDVVRRRPTGRRLWVAAAVAVAACLLAAVVLWQLNDRRARNAKQMPGPEVVEKGGLSEEPSLPPSPWSKTRMSQARGDLSSEPPVVPFSWPVDGTVKALPRSRLAADLLD